MFRKIAILLLPLILSVGCIKEEMDDCGGGIRFQFSYMHNPQGKNLLAEQVCDIRIYLFDERSGTLAHMIRPSRNDIIRGYMDADVLNGKYSVVAWGGSGEDMMLGGYLDGDMTNSASPAYTSPATIGSSTLGSFRLMLSCDPFTVNAEGCVAPRNVNFDDLFFANSQHAMVQKGTRTTVELDFIKNSSILKISITGLEYLSTYTPSQGKSTYATGNGQPLIAYLMAKNGIYGYDNQIDTSSPEVRYEPPCRSLSATTMEIDIKVLRLDIAYHANNPVLLYLQNPVTGQDVVFPLNILDVIMKAKDTQGNLLYRTQDDIDRQDEFPIVISILSDLSVSITVNGFEVVETTPDISRP